MSMYFFITLTFKDGGTVFVGNSSAHNYIDFTEVNKFALRIHRDRLGDILKLVAEQIDKDRDPILIAAVSWFKDVEPTVTWEPKEDATGWSREGDREFPKYVQGKMEITKTGPSDVPWELRIRSGFTNELLGQYCTLRAAKVSGNKR